MANWPRMAGSACLPIFWKLTTSAAVIAVAAACSPLSKMGARKHLAAPAVAPKPPRKALKPTNPLHIATAYWAGQYKKKPNDPIPALNYARNLKAMGSRDRAMSVLKRAHGQFPAHAEIASDYGRLVLATGNVHLALRVLKSAEKPGGKTDWRVLSAKGTAYAKLGKHAEAQQYFKGALQQNPKSPNVSNNLALSYAMSGSPDKAENLLRRTIKSGQDTPRLRQNLALVLGLQHKFTEAQQVASLDLSKDKASQNMAYLRKMVRAPSLAQTAQRQIAEVEKPAPLQLARAQKKPQKMATTQTPMPLRRPVVGKTPDAARHFSSRTMPLPWRTRSRKPSVMAETHIASAETVPLPTPKPEHPAPGGKAATPAPLPTRKSVAPVARARPKKPTLQAAAAHQRQPLPKVSGWQARKAPKEQAKQEKRAIRTSSRNLLYPGLD